ncbi:MAG: hypothetical protein HOD92_25325 [Deltaproteobacteria bacterium]|jgi:hypothetical protein|nr:hypothetical protein [Deltaproteobacteria bacterium]MBT4525082.1 hypothetical protein [Deltaproteobacteria bacterium]
MTIFLSIVALIIVILSFPVQISAIHSPTVFTVSWFFIKVSAVLQGKKIILKYQIFGLKLKSRPKKEKLSILKKKKKPQKKAAKKNKFRKISIDFIKEIIYHPLFKKILHKALNLLKRLLKSIDFRKLSADIGLNDCYWQGIIHGISHRFNSKRIQIRNNYLENNYLELDLKISIWKVLYALLIFLGSFPYLKTFRFYKQTLLEK